MEWKSNLKDYVNAFVEQQMIKEGYISVLKGMEKECEGIHLEILV
mgnify:CR=1 FL=1